MGVEIRNGRLCECGERLIGEGVFRGEGEKQRAPASQLIPHLSPAAVQTRPWSCN